MENQQTLVVIKPDGIAKGLVGLIINALYARGLTIVDSARARLTQSWVKQLYAAEKNKPYFLDAVNWVSSAPVLLLKIRGCNAVAKVKRQIIGKYPNGMRGQYSENQIKNIAHAPDSLFAAKRELQLAEKIFLRRKVMGKKRFEGKMVFALTGMSECGKSTVGKYLDLQGVPRLKIVKLFGKVHDKQAPDMDFKEFIAREEQRDPFALWDAFIDELLNEMDNRNATIVSIESLYGGGLGPYLREMMADSFCIVYIDAPEEKRLEFQVIREGLFSIEKAKLFLLPRDKIKTDSGIPQLKDIAGEIINNTGTVEDLYRAIDVMVRKYR